jgi:hypothetical protein
MEPKWQYLLKKLEPKRPLVYKIDGAKMKIHAAKMVIHPYKRGVQNDNASIKSWSQWSKNGNSSTKKRWSQNGNSSIGDSNSGIIISTYYYLIGKLLLFKEEM